MEGREPLLIFAPSNNNNNNNNNMTKQVLKALNHVRKHHPQVCMVVFSKDLRWQYMDENFNTPKFGKEIDATILEEAVDSLLVFPCVFEL